MSWTVEKSVACLKGDKGISPGDKKLILKFVQERRAVANLSINRVLKVITYMKILTRLKKGKDWSKFKSRNDIVALIGKINSSIYAPNTMSDLKKQFKQFYRWKENNKHPPEIEDIKVSFNGANRKKPEEMLDESDVLRMVEAAKFVRDKCIIMCLWTLGCRASECLSLRRGDVFFDEMGARIHLRGTKTPNADRVCRVVECVPYLREYLEKWHNNKDSDSPLWLMISNSGKDKPLTYAALNMLLHRIAKKAGVKKPVFSHNFRSSRASFLAQYLTSAQLKSYFGWASIAMGDVYIAMQDRSTDEAILKLSGKGEKAKPKQSKLTPISCPRCHVECGPEAQFCTQCSYPLTPGAAIMRDDKQAKRDRFLDKIMKKYPHLLEE